MHRMLSDSRVRHKGTRELFAVNLCTAEAVIEAAAASPTKWSWLSRLRLPRIFGRGFLWRVVGAGSLAYVAMRILIPV